MNESPSLMQVLDSLTSYAIAFFLLSFTTIVDNASTVMTLGGMVLLGLRIYVDFVKARKTYAEHQDWKYERKRS